MFIIKSMHLINLHFWTYLYLFVELELHRQPFSHTIINVIISSIVNGLENSDFPLFHLPSCY